MSQADPRRSVPRTDVLLAHPALVAAADRHGAGAVRSAVRSAQARVRAGEIAPGEVVAAAQAALPARSTTLRPLLNATGVVVHTNIGRAPLSDAAIEAIGAAAGYVDVEFDTATGARARRGRGTLDALRAAVPGAGDALVVNNGAAALVLATTALAAGREVVVSRGEMVEIGDGFRLPDLIASTGARLREVGTTNRTRLADYAAVVGPDTGCVLKVHPSNFRVEGFTSAASVQELATLGVPLVVDIGSGLLGPDPLIPDEPDATTVLHDGATVVTASGDKLLGGPQAGLVLGEAATVERLRRHPLARALRVDKLTLAALEATLRGPVSPVTAYLHADGEGLRARTERLAAVASGDVVAVEGRVGGGGAPGVPLPGWAVALPEACAERLRRGEPGVVARVERGRCLVDLRCVPPDRDGDVEAAVLSALDELDELARGKSTREG
ncbi:L-seryl-tRNA(Sec) selenium transferase [Humibacillus xanthopallidus]|uniref:L-seryl-tRNA(Sec) selenium transferase n=1 Tax=Humibacillus xanthopallidus TaxID=412689 RepID=A0A543PP75_9MICO|nr:L-seryl-tRNA(Sec) selenium transferase [Humibacillus xanthopallidus]TQN45882.1 L-seryl-tRNA(Sec) selenium transferase [Humibacillus xanthopallidus]